MGVGSQPMTTMAPMTSMAYGQAMMQTRAATAVEYIQQAPAVEYIQQAPMVEYVQQGTRGAQVAPRNLLAMGNVVSERVISREELASRDRYAALEPTMVQAPREMVVQQPQVTEYIQTAPRVEYVQAAPAVEYIQPQTVTMAPQMMTTMAPQTMMAAPMAYGAPRTTVAAQTMTMAPQTMTA